MSYRRIEVGYIRTHEEREPLLVPRYECRYASVPLTDQMMVRQAPGDERQEVGAKRCRQLPFTANRVCPEVGERTYRGQNPAGGIISAVCRALFDHHYLFFFILNPLPAPEGHNFFFTFSVPTTGSSVYPPFLRPPPTGPEGLPARVAESVYPEPQSVMLFPRLLKERILSFAENQLLYLYFHLSVYQNFTYTVRLPVLLPQPKGRMCDPICL